MLGHLISFRTDFDPKIHFWKKDEVDELELIGREMNVKFSDYILCTGHKTLDSRHKCPYKFKGKKQCGYCRNKDISKVYTRLDFTGYEEFEEEYVHQKFSLYLAGFGDELVKCGVTKTERVEKRLKEQGADFWVELMRFDNGQTAYETEVELQNRFDLKNFVRNDTKLKLLGKPKNSDFLKQKLDQIKSDDDYSSLLNDPKIRENVFSVPDKFEVANHIDGKITGCKSQMIFFEQDSVDFVFPIYKAIGRIFLLKE
jgi:uncharacterized Fe-S cluster-containing protein